MEKTIIITEKPSVAQDYRKALNITPNGKRDGFIEGYSPVFGGTVIISWCVGHLCTLAYPEAYDQTLKKWNLHTLPFLPKEYRYEVIQSVKKQFDIIKMLYHDKDLSAIYYAGDAGKEGLYIQMLVRQMAGIKPGITEKVVWVDSYTEREILRGIKEAKELSCYEEKKKAAYVRAIEDYAVGINFSRALSCKFGSEFNQRIKSEKWTPIAVGRVMSCVLGMVVEREREIRDFMETPFYKVIADVGFEAEWKAVETSAFHNSPFLYSEAGFKERDKAELLQRTMERSPLLEVESIRVTQERKYAPLLFNLAEIQFACSKKYRISPDETLAVLQSLYEKRLVTYPRTDARVLSSAVAGEIQVNLNGLSGLGYKKDCILKIAENEWYKGIIRSQYVNDEKITDHYAIIPTGTTEGVNELSERETRIYHDIVDRFLSIFYPPAVYTKAEMVLKHDMGEKFFVGKRTLRVPGYMEVLEEAWDIMPNEVAAIEKDQILPAVFRIREGKTEPPKRYSSGSMIIRMENAGKMIVDEALREQIKGCGIGTSATRAEIIKKLVSIHYLILDKKTQILTPSNVGECVYDIINSNIPQLLKPEMTANWERGLNGIEDGRVSAEVYLQKMEQYITTVVNGIKTGTRIQFKAGDEAQERRGIPCPLCKKGIIRENDMAYGCSEYKNGCTFTIWKTVAGKELTPNQIEKLITGERTPLIKGFRRKDGGTFDAQLILKKGKVAFVFPHRRKKD